MLAHAVEKVITDIIAPCCAPWYCVCPAVVHSQDRNAKFNVVQLFRPALDFQSIIISPELRGIILSFYPVFSYM